MLVVLMLAAAPGLAADLTPGMILKKAEAVYKSLDTYKSQGSITSDVDTGAIKAKVETSFSMILKKPNRYLISWTQKNAPMPGMSQSGTVWSDGRQAYLYIGRMQAYTKMKHDEAALASATGISGGAAFTIPSVFLSVFKEQATLFSRLKGPKLERAEKVGDDDCYVISGPSAISKKETLWISKKSHLIKKYARSLEPPKEGLKALELTDEQLDEAIAAMGQEVTPERRQQMREMMKQSKAFLKTGQVKGVSTETHAKISSPQLKTKDFQFALPAGTVLKESLFGGAPGARKSQRK